VAKGVRHGTVESQRCADADTHHHEAELVVEAIREHAPEIILDHRKEDRESGHGGADPDQHVGSRETARQSVNREFGGEGGKHHRTEDGCFGVGILQPVVEQWKGAFDAEGDKDEPRTEADETELVKGDGAGRAVVENHPGQKDDSGSDRDDKIPHA